MSYLKGMGLVDVRNSWYGYCGLVTVEWMCHVVHLYEPFITDVPVFGMVLCVYFGKQGCVGKMGHLSLGACCVFLT